MGESRVILLDGGMGQEIVNRGGKGGYGEWATAALHEDPDMVRQIHCDYIRAGADVITTNTYATTRTRLRHLAMEDRLDELVKVAGQLALQARDDCAQPDVQIATSLSPLEASYASEFALSYQQTVAEFAELMDLLDPYIDIYLGETLSTIFEARALLEAASGRGKPVWLSLTLQDHGSSNLRSGERLSEAIESFGNMSPDALLINCCTPDSISSALPALRASGLPFGAYANGFVEIPDIWDEQGGVSQLATRTDLTPEVYAGEARAWIDGGATIVGGCCEVGPAHIARLRELIDQSE